MSSNAPQGAIKTGSNLPISEVYAFGPYRLEVPARRLLRDAEPVSLTPKAFDILLALIERRGRLQFDLAAQEFQTSLARLATSAFPLAIGRAYLDGSRLDDGLAQLDRAVAIEPTCAGFIATSPAFASYRQAPPFAARLAVLRASGN